MASHKSYLPALSSICTGETLRAAVGFYQGIVENYGLSFSESHELLHWISMRHQLAL